MRVLTAGRALLFDVGNLPVRRDFPVVARDAATPERREAEETNKTHHGDPPTDLEQFLYRRAHTRDARIVSDGAHSCQQNLGVFLWMRDPGTSTKTVGRFPSRVKAARRLNRSDQHIGLFFMSPRS